MSKKNSNNKTKWLLIGGGAVLAASLAIGLGVHFGTQSEPESPMDIFVREMSKVSEENTDKENKETIINNKEYELIEGNKIFCGGTDLADAQKELKQFIDAYQLKQSFLIKPHSITATTSTKKTFSNYRDEKNVEKNCWDVVISDFPAPPTAKPPQDSVNKIAQIYSNIAMRYESTSDINEFTTLTRNLMIHSNIYCVYGYRLKLAQDTVKELLPTYEIPDPTVDLTVNIAISGDGFRYPSDYKTTTSLGVSNDPTCWKVTPKTT